MHTHTQQARTDAFAHVLGQADKFGAAVVDDKKHHVQLSKETGKKKKRKQKFSKVIDVRSLISQSMLSLLTCYACVVYWALKV